MRARTVGDVIVHAHGEGVRLLEHHAHALAQGVDVDFAVQVDPVDEDLARDLAVRDEVVHAVERLQKGRFAAARGPDEGSDLLFADLHIDVFERPEFAVVQVEVGDLELDGPLFFVFVRKARARARRLKDVRAVVHFDAALRERRARGIRRVCRRLFRLLHGGKFLFRRLRKLVGCGLLRRLLFGQFLLFFRGFRLFLKYVQLHRFSTPFSACSR